MQIKKFRKEQGMFLVEGAKSIEETFRSDFKIHSLFLTQEYRNCWDAELRKVNINPEIVTEDDLIKAGTLKSNKAGLAIVMMKEINPVYPARGEYILALDDVRDPGNLGTIVRIADWYGIKNIACSMETAEIYNPKVISASMGSFTRVNCFYCNLETYISSSNVLSVYGAFLDGQSVHQTEFSSEGLIVLGNESTGISSKIEKMVTAKVTIPRFGSAESLNVAIATAVICDNMKRFTLEK